MKEELHIEWEILISKLNNTISEKDLEVFNTWLSSDKSNQIFFENLKMMKENEPHLKRYDEINIDRAWNKIENKTRKKTPTKNIAMQFLKYAAVFILGVFSLYGVYQLTNSNEINNLSSTYHTVKVPNGAKAEITLADGTNIVLNSGSQLTYPEFFAADKREVKLSGEAYFDVERDEERPFTIETKDIKVKVLGTSFNVKAYPEDETVETFVESGKVEVELSNVSVQQKKIFLTQNEKAVFTKGTKQIALEEKQEGKEEVLENNEIAPISKQKPQLLISIDNDSKEELAWKEERFIFKNEPMESLIKKLERWYGVEIELNKKVLTEFHFTGTFERETIEEVLNAIAYSIPIKWKKEHKKILIYSKD